jgi:hypothetical protein
VNTEYLYIKPSCIAIARNTAIVGSLPIRLTRVSRVILNAIIAGGGRLDVIARAASANQRLSGRWAEDFTALAESSQLIGVHRVLSTVWPSGTMLVSDWCGEINLLGFTDVQFLHWRRDPDDKQPQRIRLGGPTSLFFEAQIIRGMLGATSRRLLFLLGSADRVLFGDLIHRHRAIVMVSPDWPQSRRVWQYASEVLREEQVWLEHFFYALRNCDETSSGDLSARSGTVMAAQEARGLFDARFVYCWSRAQQKELVRFYGRTRASSPIVGEVAQRANPSSATVLEAVEFLLRSSHSRLNGRGSKISNFKEANQEN